MKCVILCMCCNKPQYLEEFKLIKEYWGKDIMDKEYPDIDIWAYTSSQSNDFKIDLNEHMLYVPCRDDLYGTFDKTVKAIQALDFFNIDYDWIVRTNCSTIINVKLLDAFLHSEIIDSNKVYAGELYMGGWKGAPEEWFPFIRGNFYLMTRKYAKLINYTGLEIAKQANNYDRHINRDLFLADDLCINSILNTYLLMNNILPTDFYRQIPQQFIDSIYRQETQFKFNTMVIPVKSMGISSKDLSIEEYFDEMKEVFIDFCTKYYSLMTDNLDELGAFIEKENQTVIKYITDENGVVTGYRYSFKEYEQMFLDNNVYVR